MKALFTIVFVLVSIFAQAQDAIDPRSIEVVGGSPNVTTWRVTAAVTRVTLWPGNFEAIDTSDWPNKVPPGWDGPIDKTLWIVVFKDGQWRTTGSIEFWKGRTQTQSPLSSGLQDWWYYAPEIGQPQPGETVGVFYAAGDQRRKDVRTVEERTNIVTFVVPTNDTGSFSFAAVPPVVTPPPVVVPPPPVVQPPAPPPPIIVQPPDLSAVTTRIDQLAQQLALHEAQSATRQQELLAAIDEPGFVKRFFSNRLVQMGIAAASVFVEEHFRQQMGQP
jgi:hypothetical protein